MVQPGERSTADMTNLGLARVVPVDLSEADLLGLARRLHQRRYARGGVVFLRDDPTESLHIVKSGAVRIGLTSSDTLSGPWAMGSGLRGSPWRSASLPKKSPGPRSASVISVPEPFNRGKFPPKSPDVQGRSGSLGPVELGTAALVLPGKGSERVKRIGSGSLA